VVVGRTTFRTSESVSEDGIRSLKESAVSIQRFMAPCL